MGWHWAIVKPIHRSGDMLVYLSILPCANLSEGDIYCARISIGYTNQTLQFSLTSYEPLWNYHHQVLGILININSSEGRCVISRSCVNAGAKAGSGLTRSCRRPAGTATSCGSALRGLLCGGPGWAAPHDAWHEGDIFVSRRWVWIPDEAEILCADSATRPDRCVAVASVPLLPVYERWCLIRRPPPSDFLRWCDGTALRSPAGTGSRARPLWFAHPIALARVIARLAACCAPPDSDTRCWEPRFSLTPRRLLAHMHADADAEMQPCLTS